MAGIVMFGNVRPFAGNRVPIDQAPFAAQLTTPILLPGNAGMIRAYAKGDLLSRLASLGMHEDGPILVFSLDRVICSMAGLSYNKSMNQWEKP